VLYHQQRSAASGDPFNLSQGFHRIRNGAKDQSGYRRIESVIGKGQGLSVGLCKFNAGLGCAYFGPGPFQEVNAGFDGGYLGLGRVMLEIGPGARSYFQHSSAKAGQQLPARLAQPLTLRGGG
jgi:hypothetical protein